MQKLESNQKVGTHFLVGFGLVLAPLIVVAGVGHEGLLDASRGFVEYRE